MDEILYSIISDYYKVLEKLGNYSYNGVLKMLLLFFYRDFMYHDYRGLLSKEDYHEIELALNCIYGTDCLIPYPDYVTMGKLKLGEISELAHRIQVLENTNVLKVIHDQEDTSTDPESDIVFVEAE